MATVVSVSAQDKFLLAEGKITVYCDFRKNGRSVDLPIIPHGEGALLLCSWAEFSEKHKCRISDRRPHVHFSNLGLTIYLADSREPEYLAYCQKYNHEKWLDKPVEV